MSKDYEDYIDKDNRLTASKAQSKRLIGLG
jgi:hypothetical protein